MMMMMIWAEVFDTKASEYITSVCYITKYTQKISITFYIVTSGNLKVCQHRFNLSSTLAYFFLPHFHYTIIPLQDYKYNWCTAVFIIVWKHNI